MIVPITCQQQLWDSDLDFPPFTMLSYNPLLITSPSSCQMWITPTFNTSFPFVIPVPNDQNKAKAFISFVYSCIITGSTWIYICYIDSIQTHLRLLHSESLFNPLYYFQKLFMDTKRPKYRTLTWTRDKTHLEYIYIYIYIYIYLYIYIYIYIKVDVHLLFKSILWGWVRLKVQFLTSTFNIT